MQKRHDVPPLWLIGRYAAWRRTSFSKRPRQRSAGFLQLVVRLQPQPEAFRRAEVAGEAERRICRDGPLLKHDLVDPAGRHVDVTRHATLAEPKRNQELLSQDFAGVNIRKFGHRSHLSKSPSGSRRYQGQRGEAEGDAVRQRERGDGLHQRPSRARGAGAGGGAKRRPHAERRARWLSKRSAAGKRGSSATAVVLGCLRRPQDQCAGCPAA